MAETGGRRWCKTCCRLYSTLRNRSWSASKQMSLKLGTFLEQKLARVLRRKNSSTAIALQDCCSIYFILFSCRRAHMCNKFCNVFYCIWNLIFIEVILWCTQVQSGSQIAKKSSTVDFSTGMWSIFATITTDKLLSSSSDNSQTPCSAWWCVFPFIVLNMGLLECFCYLKVKTAWSYLHSSGYSTSVCQTNGRTDGQTDGIAVANTALCIASNAAVL